MWQLFRPETVRIYYAPTFIHENNNEEEDRGPKGARLLPVRD